MGMTHGSGGAASIGGILFDMDGVIVQQRLDFLAIKQEIFGTTHGFILERLGLCFDAVVTREDAPPKPAPEPVRLACRQMGLTPSDVLFVGDFEFDMLAGRRAGARTVLLRNPALAASEHADLTVDSLGELRGLLEAGCRVGCLLAPD